MDHPSILKLLEDDVDESMHSGADVEALSAALNRDIGGDSSTFSKPSDCQSVGVLPPASTQPKQEQSDAQHSEQQSSEIAKQEVKDQVQKEETKVVKTEEKDQAKASDQNSLQLPKQENFQHVKAEPQNSTVNEANGAKRIRTAAAPSSSSSSSPSIPFQLLIPIIRPHLDKDRSMQLQSVFSKLRTNEVSKEDFLRVIRNIIGDQMLRQAVNKVHTQLQTQAQNQASKNQQPSPNPIPLQHQASQQQLFPHGPHQYPSPRALSSLPIGTSQSKNVSSTENNGQRSRETESNRNFPNQEVNKQQQPPQRPQTSFPMGGGIPSNFNSHPYARPSMNASPASLRPHATQPGTVINVTNYELQNITNGTNRLHGGSMQNNANSSWQAMANKEQRSNSLPTPMPYMKQEGADQAIDNSNKSQIAPATQDGPSFGNPTIGNLNHDPMKPSSRMGFPNNAGTQANYRETVSQIPSFAGPMTKTPPKKPMVGQKKPLEGPTTSAAMASKKQKTAGTGHDQSIDQLNDVTAVSGVDLRAEEEQLLSAPREDSRATEAIRKIVQEEEERLILQKGPLQTKLTDIMLKSGLKKIGSDVERCISVCLEERLRGVVGSLIRLSKQRVDSEKPRHHFVVTSDVGRHILDINNKVKEEWDKKQAEEAEKQKKINDVEGNTGSDGEDNDGRSKVNKANKDEDDKMRANAANVAARAAVGGDDMLSKWQLMAEQARQKREGHDAPSPSSQPVKPTSSKMTSSNLRRNLKAPQGSHKRGASVTGGNRKLGRSTIAMSQPKVVRNISRKDVIAFLRREPQMTKSTLLYRLYNKSSSDSAIE